MAGLDRETLERVARWCAEAGRTAGTAAIRAALEPLRWDELLVARALLADPPPARPLGPYALADLARGTPLDQAVERERDGRYPSVEASASLDPADRAPAQADTAPAPPAPAAPSAKARGKAARAARLAPVLRKKAAAPAPPPAAAPLPLPLLDELLLPAGRNALERLIRRHGGKPAALVAALAGGQRRADGAPIDRADLDRLLEHHGLRRAYLRRERDELLHAVRAAGGVLAAAATALGVDREALISAAARLEVDREVEALRADRRKELGAKVTLSERARLLLVEEARLGDLGLLEAFEADLRERLPAHLRALAASREPLPLALATSLSLEPEAAVALVTRLGLTLDVRPQRAPRPPDGMRARPPRPPGGPRGGPPDRRPGRAPDRGAGRPPGRERPGAPSSRGFGAGPGTGPISGPRSGPRPGPSSGPRSSPGAPRSGGPPADRPRRPGPSSSPGARPRPEAGRPGKPGGVSGPRRPPSTGGPRRPRSGQAPRRPPR